MDKATIKISKNRLRMRLKSKDRIRTLYHTKNIFKLKDRIFCTFFFKYILLIGNMNEENGLVCMGCSKKFLQLHIMNCSHIFCNNCQDSGKFV